MKNVGQNIARIRQARGLNQTQLAELVGVAQPHISRIENGYEKPPLLLFRLIADKLHVSLADIVADERTAAELALIDAFRALPAGRQQGWLDMARLVQDQAEATAEEADGNLGQTAGL